MENTEIKSEKRIIRSKIVLKNLSKEQKELLSSGAVIAGGIGVGAGLFTLYSMNEPDVIPGIQPTFGFDSPPAEMINTEPKEQEEQFVLYTEKPIQEVNNENISFGEAFKVARGITGPGGWFIWKGNIYNTYLKEEWQSMPSVQKQEYLASLNMQNEPEQTAVNDIKTEEILSNIEQPDLPEVELTSDTLTGTVVAEAEADRNEVVIESEPQVNTSKEFSIDFSDLYGNKTEKLNTNTEQESVTPTATKTEELVQGEIITLDDDTDLSHGDIFELEDSIEIILLPESESIELDSLILDSNQITEFPWGEAVGKTEVQGEIEETVIAHDVNNEATSEITNAPQAGSKEEYPWGEPVVKATAEAPILESNQEQHEEIIAPTITKPEEITEYPWGERIDNSKQITGVIAIAPEGIKISQEEIQPQIVSSFDDIEEFPWGEKNNHFNPENKLDPQVVEGIIQQDNENETIGLIINANSEPISHEQLPSSFNDITELPWGESILDSPVGYRNESNQSDNVIDPLGDHSNILTDEPQ